MTRSHRLREKIVCKRQAPLLEERQGGLAIFLLSGGVEMKTRQGADE